MRHVVITGGSRGIGYGLARVFLELECRVTLAGRTESSTREACERLASEVPGARERIRGQACDVTDSDQLEAFWQYCAAQAPVDVWINNAGVSPRYLPLWELSASELRSVMDTNVSGVLIGSWVALRGMRAQGSGTIYNLVGFGADGQTHPGSLPYGTSKRAVAYLSKALAREASGSKVRICTTDPGAVRTEMVAAAWGELAAAKPWVGAIIDALALDPRDCARLLAPRLLDNRRSGVCVRPWNGLVFWLRILAVPVVAAFRLRAVKTKTIAR